jgi:hypothetical protein
MAPEMGGGREGKIRQIDHISVDNNGIAGPNGGLEGRLSLSGIFRLLGSRRYAQAPGNGGQHALPAAPVPHADKKNLSKRGSINKPDSTPDAQQH